MGDWIVADMRAYSNVEPDYGDIIVFSGLDDQLYLYRIAGKPNDILEINDNIITINGEESKVKFIRNMVIEGLDINVYEEEYPNGHKHTIYKLQEPLDEAKANIEKIIVPSDSYYVLGDNRDLAFDSRYLGHINKNQIIGRATCCYFGETTDRINIDLRKR